MYNKKRNSKCQKPLNFNKYAEMQPSLCRQPHGCVPQEDRTLANCTKRPLQTARRNGRTGPSDGAETAIKTQYNFNIYKIG